ncbi:copper-binding protein [Variovorax sp. HW608]|uniref:copper-binding protein n=1 Tax=Variovorax sp. HW608 TaxID=1034889 RepID=UPI0012FDED87|nr:copper-binding protein [Variovorax sp. HW608]
MNRLQHLAIAAILATAGSLAFGLSEHHDEPASHPPPHARSDAGPTELPYDGVVRRIDRKHSKITLKNGPNVNLGTSAMTREYLAADNKLLDSLKEGDKVRFNAEHSHGAFVLTGIKKVP